MNLKLGSLAGGSLGSYYSIVDIVSHVAASHACALLKMVILGTTGLLCLPIVTYSFL